MERALGLKNPLTVVTSTHEVIGKHSSPTRGWKDVFDDCLRKIMQDRERKCASSTSGEDYIERGGHDKVGFWEKSCRYRNLPWLLITAITTYGREFFYLGYRSGERRERNIIPGCGNEGVNVCVSGRVVKRPVVKGRRGPLDVKSFTSW